MGQKISRATIFLAYCKINIILNIICVRFFDQISIRTLSLIYSDRSLTKKNFRNHISTTLFHSFARKLESEKSVTDDLNGDILSLFQIHSIPRDL